jgi:hypothetical protein
MAKTMMSVTVKQNIHVLNGQGQGQDKELYGEFLARLGGTDQVRVQVQVQAQDNTGDLVITAGSIKPLTDVLPLDYLHVEKMILDLGVQMLVLAKYQTGLCGLTLDAISVLNEDLFLLTDLQQVRAFKKVKAVTAPSLLAFTYPITVTDSDQAFLAPELREKLEAKVLPFTTTRSVGYYSLAKLCLACLQLENLEPLQGSKLYYFLERCLQVEPSEREFLYF